MYDMHYTHLGKWYTCRLLNNISIYLFKKKRYVENEEIQQ